MREHHWKSKSMTAIETQSGIRDDFRNLARKSAIYGLGSILLRGISIFLLPLYTRYLTPADYGVIAVTGTITAILGILYPLGLHGAATRLYFDAQNEVDRYQRIGTLWMGMILSATVIAVFVDRIGNSVTPLLLKDVPFSPYIRLAIWTGFFNIFSLLPLNLFQISERPGSYVFTSVGSTLLTVCLIIGLVVFCGQGAYGYLLAVLLAGALLAVPYVLVTLKYIQVILRKDILKTALVYSLPLIPHGVASWMLALSDRLILEHYVTLEQLGLYSLGYQFGSVMNMAATAINFAWVPFLFRLDSEQGEAAKPRLARLVTYYTLILSWVALGLALLAKDAILFLTPPAFHEAHSVIPWIIGGFLLSGFYLIPANYLFLKSKTVWIPIVTVFSGAINVGFNLLLSPDYGIMAAAWANFLANGVMLALVWALTLRVYPFPYEYKRLGQIMLTVLGSFVVGNVLAFQSASMETAVRGVIWLAYPFVLVVLGFFTISEKEKALTFLKQALVTLSRRA
jgi:O-antigen/teichoic acid export membrane protein